MELSGQSTPPASDHAATSDHKLAFGDDLHMFHVVARYLLVRAKWSCGSIQSWPQISLAEVKST